MASPLPVPSETDEEQYKSQRLSAFIIGYTGATGKDLVNVLNEKKVFSRVVLIGRRRVELSVGPEFEQKVINFDNPEEHNEAVQGCDVGFCCLGTTRGIAGKEGFIKVDRDYVIYNAEAAKNAGCKSYHVVTAGGANSSSCILYTRVKGEVEDACKRLAFDRLFLIHPGGILAQHPNRPAETCAIWMLKPLTSCCPTWITITPRLIALGMVHADISSSVQKVPTPQEFAIENRELHRLSGVNSGGCC